MGNGMDKVCKGLYIGSVRDAKDPEQIKKNNITHIICIHENPKKGPHQKVEYLCVLATDQPEQNLVQFFPQCNDFIHAARLKEGNVLIHCLAGVSRSVTILVAYLMSVTPYNWKDCLKCVRSARPIANPNLGFQKQLQDFEGRRLREERKRLIQKFGANILRPGDEEELKMILMSGLKALCHPHPTSNSSSPHSIHHPTPPPPLPSQSTVASAKCTSSSSSSSSSSTTKT